MNPWKYTTILLTMTILIWTYIDYRNHPEHPYRLALWLSPLLNILIVGALLWWEHIYGPGAH